MLKVLQFNQQARDSLAKGIQTLADAVGATYGPMSSNVVLAPTLVPPKVLHDGVSVAQDIELVDPFENAGVQIVKQAAKETAEGSGDGTTASIVFANALVVEGLKALDSGYKGMQLRSEMEQAKIKVVESIREMAIPIGTGDILRIATISAQDAELGRIVAEVVEKMGQDGVVQTEDSFGDTTTVTYVPGMQFPKGYASQAFVNRTSIDTAELEDTLIFVSERPLTDSKEMLHILRTAQLDTNRVVVVADIVDGGALQTAEYANTTGEVQVLCVSAPGFSHQKIAYLHDIALVTGATLLGKKDPRKATSISIEDFGRAERVSSTHDTTTIVGGQGNQEKIQERAQQLRDSIAEATEPYKKEQLREQLAKVGSGVATIHVGAVTDVELRERKERILDAIPATRSAFEEGIVPGGAVTLLRATQTLGNTIGEKVIRQAAVEVFRKLIVNSGIDFTSAYKQIQTAEPNYGYNVATGEYVDLVEAGVVDPAKVTRLTVEHAISVAGSVLTSSVIVADYKEPKGCGVRE